MGARSHINLQLHTIQAGHRAGIKFPCPGFSMREPSEKTSVFQNNTLSNSGLLRKASMHSVSIAWFLHLCARVKGICHQVHAQNAGFALGIELWIARKGGPGDL